jgi:opacity protein-like surface antigen
MTRTLALAAVFVLLFAATADAQEVVRVRGNRTPLRSEPTTTSTALTYYQAGTLLQVIESVDGWYKVRDPVYRIEGFIKATLVDVVPGATLPVAPGKVTGPTQPRAGQPGVSAARKPPVRARPAVGWRGVAEVNLTWMAASESFKAVADTSRRLEFGGGLQVVNVWKGLFVECTVGWSRLDGSRAFVYNGTVYDMGIPLTITFIPVNAGAGWRFGRGKTVHPYAGGGMTFLKYREESDFAEAGDDTDEVFTGFYVAGGVEFRLAKWVHLRGEARYTTLPNALGTGGVSKDFGETNLGGAAVAVKLAIGK